MPCYNPLSGWRSSTINPTGKRSISFSLHSGLSDQPIDVPCGKCTGCISDNAMAWSIRAYHESQSHLFNSFLTLTYAPEFLPDDGLISKKELQLFFKRLRRSYSDFKYIACGEYGSKDHRAHYHAIIFGCAFDEAIYKYNERVQDGNLIWDHKLLEKIWGRGFVTVGSVELASIMYVCRYTFKKVDDDDTFRLASRKPSPGKNWLLKDGFLDDLRRTGTVTMEGQVFQIPQRYFDWADGELDEVKVKRRRYALIKKAADTSIHTARNRERNHKRKLNLTKEKI